MQKHTTLKLFLFLIITYFINGTSYSQNYPRTLYAINGSAQTLSKMDLNSKEITQNILTLGEVPNRIITHNNMLYVVNSKPDNIMVIDPVNDTITKTTIPLTEGSNPWAMAFVSDTKAYVTNFNSDSVSVIDFESGNVIKSVKVGKAPEGIIVNGTRAYIANTGYDGWGNPYVQSTVTIMDITADTVIASVNVPTNAQDLAFAPDGKLHVVCTGDYTNELGKVAVIDIDSETPTVVDTIFIGGSPGDIEISSNGFGFCSAWGDGTNGYIYKYDANADTVINNSENPILVGPNVSGLYFDSEDNSLWIPYMTAWGGDGFAQKFSVDADSVVWTSDVLGNGTSAITIVESFLVSVETKSTTPESFYLAQNYPNPFNPTTTIKYSIQNSGFVSLKVYNILGKEITTLVNRNQAAGNYEINFDASNLTSGVYIYQLNSGNKVQIKKMIFLK